MTSFEVVVTSTSSSPPRRYVEVADNGEGSVTFDAGSGLRGLQDRVVSLGGEFDVQSSNESGTRIQARIPHDDTSPFEMS